MPTNIKSSTKMNEYQQFMSYICSTHSPAICKHTVSLSDMLYNCDCAD